MLSWTLISINIDVIFFPQILVIPCDVTNDDNLKTLVDETVKKFGRIDVLVCNTDIYDRKQKCTTCTLIMYNSVQYNEILVGFFSSLKPSSSTVSPPDLNNLLKLNKNKI